MNRFVLVVAFCTFASISLAQSGDELPLNVVEWQMATQILERAQEIVVETGWYQFAPTVDGLACMTTALEDAWKELNASLVDFAYARAALDLAIDAPVTVPTSAGDPLSVPYWGRYYMYWNDAEGRTVDEVLEAFSRAAEHAKGWEAQALEVGATGDDVLEYDLTMMQELGFGH